MNKIYFESNTFWLLRDYPEEPTDMYQGDQYYGAKMDEYHDQVKACIAAKIKIDNIELIINGKHAFQNGYIFDIPDGVEFEERVTCCDGTSLVICCEMDCEGYKSKHGDKTEKVIHLKLKQEAKTELKFAYEMGIGYAPIIGREESQDELFHEVVSILLKHSNNPYSILKSKFKIQRIHPEQ